MTPVHVTVTVAGSPVSIDSLADARLAAALRGAAHDIARRLASVECPVHHRAATDLRVHFDARGNADLQYESCCADLAARIGEAM